MAVALVASSRSGASDTSGTTCTVPVPAGAASGHIALLAMKHWEPFDATGITWPTGFTQFISVLTGNRQKLYVAWKRLTAADTGNYVVSWTTTQWSQGHCLLISGALAAGDPIEASNTAAGTGTAIPSTSVTTATLAFLAHFVDSENTASETTPPTSFTKALDGDYLRANYQIPGSTGTFSAASGVLSASTAKNAALIAVKPAAGGGGPVAFDGTGSAASGATGSASVDRPLSGMASAASGGTASLAATRPLAGTSPGASGAAGSLAAGRALAGSAGSASSASGDLSVARPLAGTASAASGAAADLTTDGQVTLDGVAPTASFATGALSAARALAGTTSAASAAAGSLALTRALSGSAGSATAGAGALGVARPLVAVAAATSGASGELTVSSLPSGGVWRIGQQPRAVWAAEDFQPVWSAGQTPTATWGSGS